MDQHLIIIAFVSFIHFITSTNYANSSIKITVYDDHELQGIATNLTLPQSTDNSDYSCLPNLGKLGPSISSVNTHDNCIHVYKEQNCTGPYMIIEPGTPNSDYLSHGFERHVKSIGACFKECHIDKIHFNRTTIGGNFLLPNKTNVFLYEKLSSYSTTKLSLTIEKNVCLNITQKMTNWPYRQMMIDIKARVCIEYFSNSNCSGDSGKFWVGHHSTHYENRYWMHKDTMKSLSYCGYNCPNHAYQNDDDKTDIVSMNVVTDYSDKDHRDKNGQIRKSFWLWILLILGGCTIVACIAFYGGKAVSAQQQFKNVMLFRCRKLTNEDDSRSIIDGECGDTCELVI